MEQKIYVPQNSIEGAVEARKILQAASIEASRLRPAIESSHRQWGWQSSIKEYDTVCEAQSEALEFLAENVQALVSSGIGLNCGLTIAQRGEVSVVAYFPGSEELISLGLYRTRFGPYQTEGGANAMREYKSAFDMSKTINQLLMNKESVDKKHTWGRPCECCPEENARREASYQAEKKFFEENLKEGNKFRIEHYRMIHP